VPDALSPLRARFLERAATRPAWGVFAFAAPRGPVAVAIALLPPVVVLAVALLGGLDGAAAAFAPGAVRDAFGRFESAIVTGSSIAVSVALLALRRELRDIESLREHTVANQDYRDRLRAAARAQRTPLALGPLLALALAEVGHAAGKVREAAGPKGLAVRERGVPLGAFLDAVEANAERARRDLRAAADRPERLYHALLDVEEELTDQFARRFGRREDLSPGTRAALVQLRERLGDVVVGKGYAKTLDMQWALSRMSVAVLLTAVVGLAAAFAMALAWPDDAVRRFGAAGAVGLVALALFVVALPLGAFASYLLRIVFINQYTLPSGGFVLGPEESAAAAASAEEAEPPRAKPRGGVGLPPPT
jgi:hypothetical protein